MHTIFSQLLCFWTLSSILFLFKTTQNIFDTEFCLCLHCLQVEPTQLGPIDRASPNLRRLHSVSVFRWNLLSWIQSMEKVRLRT
jgi:hypothetical protein